MDSLVSAYLTMYEDVILAPRWAAVRVQKSLHILSYFYALCPLIASRDFGALYCTFWLSSSLGKNKSWHSCQSSISTFCVVLAIMSVAPVCSVMLTSINVEGDLLPFGFGTFFGVSIYEKTFGKASIAELAMCGYY